MSMRTRAVTAAVAVLGAVAGGLILAAPARAATVSKPLRTMIADLPVATEVRTGYDRDLFPLWVDADGDGCNARYEVLIAESVTTPTVGSGCSLSGGRWYSYYDGATWTAPADVDIDHVVPLAEAWDSGARNWTTAQRRSFANDLGDDRPLAAVTDNVNQSKGDRDPAEWMPPISGVHCRYVGEWAAVKTRWGLTVDTAEKSALTSVANGCSNVTITVQTVLGGGGTPTATATATPTSTSASCAGTNGTNADIPDAGAAVSSAITIGGCSRAASSSATIEVHIVHPYRGDLVLTLVAPDGSAYTLKSSSSSDSAANVDTTYTRNLSGEAAAGTWRLQMQDVFADDSGYLNSWTLTV
jgi:subtilisin-like proprotein convertase family protein